MAAYSAVGSIRNTIDQFLNYTSCISFVPSSKSILEFIYDKMESLQNDLENLGVEYICWYFPSERAMALEVELREAVCELEDKFESILSTQILLQSLQSDSDNVYSIDLRDFGQVVDCFAEKANKIMDEYIEEFYINSLRDDKEDDDEDDEEDDEDDEDDDEDDEDDEAVFSSMTYQGGDVSEMVGYTDTFDEIRDWLIHDTNVAIIGMAGIGKTTLAKKILEDPLILEKFDCRIFVPIGPPSDSAYVPKYRNIQKAIEAQVNLGSNNKPIYKKHIVVFDDVWDVNFLRSIEKDFPEVYSGCQVMVTTRLRILDLYSDVGRCNMRLMNKEESWDLLRGKLFADKVCPPQLEKFGKKIAENCEGLPLLIIKVAGILSESKKTPEYWNMIAEDKENSVFEKAYDQMLEVLYPSYHLLPLFTKACFLYMAIFPQNYKVRGSRLFNLWMAEYFFAPRRSPQSCLLYLYQHTVVEYDKEISLHSVFWHLCKKEAGKNLFLHILNRRANGFAENIKRQRRLAVYKNVLFSIKDVYNSVASVSNARSLLCTGAYHQYQVPICFSSLRLLRVLDVLTIRFYEFPMEVLELVLLRYLALTLDRNLPPSIFKLWNLQYLIVHQHFSIRFTLAQSYLPVAIWYLGELRHLQIIGRNLPDPPHDGNLGNLLTLLDVGPHSCTSRILQDIPRLRKLRVRIELMSDAAEPSIPFYPDFHLCEPESLQIVIVNPEIAAPPHSLPVFKSHLQKLTLNGFGHPWEELNKIAELPLQKLKLQCYAFRGETWKTENGFKALCYLYIEDTDLVQWTCPQNAFQNLRLLSMKSCYKLKEFPVFEVVHLVDCNSAEAYARVKTLELGYKLLVESSWDD